MTGLVARLVPRDTIDVFHCSGHIHGPNPSPIRQENGERIVTYREHIRSVDCLSVLARMSHVSIYIWKHTVTAPRGFTLVSTGPKACFTNHYGARHLPINNPNARGSVLQSLGNRYVVSGSLRDPGACGFKMPSTKTATTTVI